MTARTMKVKDFVKSVSFEEFIFNPAKPSKSSYSPVLMPLVLALLLPLLIENQTKP